MRSNSVKARLELRVENRLEIENKLIQITKKHL